MTAIGTLLSLGVLFKVLRTSSDRGVFRSIRIASGESVAPLPHSGSIGVVSGLKSHQSVRNTGLR